MKYKEFYIHVSQFEYSSDPIGTSTRIKNDISLVRFVNIAFTKKEFLAKVKSKIKNAGFVIVNLNVVTMGVADNSIKNSILTMEEIEDVFLRYIYNQ